MKNSKVKRDTSLLFLLVLAGALAVSAAESQPVASFERTITKKVGYTYLLSLPTGYEATGSKTWPLLVFLHGAGERGSDPSLVAKHGPPKLLRESPLSAAGKALAENFIVVSPQCPADAWWDDDGVLVLADEIAAKHKVDPHRIYLTGLSMGGYGTWSVAMKYPERFGAVVPICGGGQRLDIVRNRHKSALTSLGVWAFHGAKDTKVPLEESELMVKELKRVAVTDVQLTVYPEANHNSWTETYANPELYTWLLRHTR